MSGSLDSVYFDGIFANDDDPWSLSSSPYEAAKFERTVAALSGRRYRRAFEVGCAQGELTGRLVPLCDSLLAVDISTPALSRARERIGDRPGLTWQHMAFPREHPDDDDFDLVVLSEVAYYWGAVDLGRAAEWLRSAVASRGRVILVHWTGETDYPQAGDGAVTALWDGVSSDFTIERADRSAEYRLDLWVRE